MNITSSTEKGEEARQKAFLFHSAMDFCFGFRECSPGNNMSKLEEAWVGEGVVRGEKTGDGILEGV